VRIRMNELAAPADVDVVRIAPVLVAREAMVVVVARVQLEEELDLDNVIDERLGSSFQQRLLLSFACFQLQRQVLLHLRRTPHHLHPV